jgi:hypothetical protein
MRSSSGSASVEQKRRMSAMAAKKRVLEALNADSLERVDAHFSERTDNRQACFEKISASKTLV